MSQRETAIASICVVLSAFGAGALARYSGSFSSTPVALPAAAEKVTLPDVGSQVAAGKTFLGVIVARNSVDIASRFEGRLASVHVRLGDVVKAGELLATLDAPSLRFDLRAAQAAAQSAKVEQERASVELAQAEEQLARRKALSEAALATGEDLSSAQYQEKLARIRVDTARAQLAERAARVAELRQRNVDAELRAPFEGIVAARYLDAGANVTPATPILRLISANNLLARFAIPEEDARHIAIRKTVSIMIQGNVLRGRIEKIAPEIDAASRLIVVEAGVDAAETSIRSGEMVYVSFEVRP